MEGAWGGEALKVRYNQNPKKKKCPKSPFYFYMMDQRENFTLQGFRVETMDELTAAAFAGWKELENNPEQKEKYIRMHNQWKMENKYDLENKFDQFGRSLAEIGREAEKKRKEKEEENRNIKTTVEYGKIKGDLVNTKFYIAYFNTLCETPEGFHIPCEAGIVEYSVEDGLTRCFQEFISPIGIPLGYKFMCMKKSRETHNIPPDVEDFELYVDDYRKIFASMEKFMTGGDPGAELPPLYVMPDHTEAAQYIVKFISEEANSDKRFKIYQLPKLLYELRNAAPDLDLDLVNRVKRGEGGDKVGWIPSVSIAEVLLEKEPYNYWRGLGCDFHEALDNTCHCALAKAKGLAYHMADICSTPFNITMRSNNHAPMEAEIRDFDERMKDDCGFFTTVTRAREISMKANTMEWINPWGTRISIHAAPAGVTNIPNQFDPNSVELGFGAEQFPGLHPEIDESSDGFEASGYAGESSQAERSSYTGNCLFSLSDDEEVESVKSMGSVKSSSSTSSSIRYGESCLAGLISQDPGKMKMPSLSDPKKGTLHPLANRPGAMQDATRDVSTHLEIGKRRERDSNRITRGMARGGRQKRNNERERAMGRRPERDVSKGSGLLEIGQALDGSREEMGV